MGYFYVDRCLIYLLSNTINFLFQISFMKPYLYLAIANAVSTLVAMYGLLVLFQSVRIFLKRHSIAQKFMVLQLVLIFHNLQGFIFETLAKKNIPSSNGCLSSTVRSKGK